MSKPSEDFGIRQPYAGKIGHLGSVIFMIACPDCGADVILPFPGRGVSGPTKSPIAVSNATFCECPRFWKLDILISGYD